MKKIKFICFLLFVSISAIAQTPYPVISKQGSPSTLGKSLGGIKADSLFINAVYLDTTAANRNPYNKTYVGGQIYTTSDSSIWLWQGKWIKAKGGGGGSPYTLTKNAARDSIILSDGSNITKVKDSVNARDTFYILATGQSNSGGFPLSDVGSYPIYDIPSDTARDVRVQGWDTFQLKFTTMLITAPLTPPVLSNFYGISTQYMLAKKIARERNCIVRIVNEALGGQPISL